MPDASTTDLLPPPARPEEDLLWARVARTVAGEPGAESRAQLERALCEGAPVREAERVWAASGAARQWRGRAATDPAEAFAQAWRRVQKQEAMPLRPPADERTTPRTVVAVGPDTAARGRRRRMVAGALAAMAAAVVVAVLLPPPRTGDSVATPQAAPATELLGETGPGASTLRLADGSTVVLAARSRLVASPGYGTRHRDVELIGSAFVTVAHQPGLPVFRLRAAQAVVEDIGTAFEVRTDAAGVVTVLVTDGAVRVASREARGDTVELRRRAVVRVDTAGALRRLPDADPVAALAWTADRFVVRNAPLTQVAEAVRARFGLTLVFDSTQLGSRRVTADFGSDGARAVAATIAATLGADLEALGRDSIRLALPGRPRARAAGQ